MLKTVTFSTTDEWLPEKYPSMPSNYVHSFEEDIYLHQMNLSFTAYPPVNSECVLWSPEDEAIWSTFMLGKVLSWTFQVPIPVRAGSRLDFDCPDQDCLLSLNLLYEVE